jgi:hypothetical protein
MANEKFRIMTITSTATDTETGATSTHRRELYILQPGQKFEGFGGSRAGLLVKGTASLIVRDYHGGSRQDYEKNVNDADAWRAIRELIAAGGIVS